MIMFGERRPVPEQHTGAQSEYTEQAQDSWPDQWPRPVAPTSGSDQPVRPARLIAPQVWVGSRHGYFI